MGETGSSGALSEGFAWDFASLTQCKHPLFHLLSVLTKSSPKTKMWNPTTPPKKTKEKTAEFSVKYCHLQWTQMLSK